MQQRRYTRSSVEAHCIARHEKKYTEDGKGDMKIERGKNWRSYIKCSRPESFIKNK
jgi:hypothetical protein